MRMMLRLKIPAAKGNAAFKDGTLRKLVQETVDKIHPEATYFGPSGGYRTATIVFNLEKESDIVGILEPIWEAIEPEIELTPVMVLDDLAAGMQAAG